MTSSRTPRPRPKHRPPEGAELEAIWAEKGPKAIETLRKYDPGAYIRAIAALVADSD